MSEYRLLVAYEVFEFLEGLPAKDRKKLRGSFLEINDWPSRYSDFKEPDDTGRHLDVHICGRYAIRYWEDFADRHVKILEVSFADR
jgi:hypothetical protein